MASTDRRLARGTRRGENSLRTLAEELRNRRLTAGLPQQSVANGARISRSRYSRIETGKVPDVGLLEASRLASFLGLDLVVRAYPATDPPRDSAHARRLLQIVAHVRPPLRYRTDAPLPQQPDRPPELRAWDLELAGPTGRAVIEIEMRLHDIQELIRRHALKRRDDPADAYVLAIADTPANRRTLKTYGDLLADLPRIPSARFYRLLESGTPPPTGHVLV